MVDKPTITYSEFMLQAGKAREELEELICIINTETLPLMVAGCFHEGQIPPLAQALEVLKQITDQKS